MSRYLVVWILYSPRAASKQTQCLFSRQHVRLNEMKRWNSSIIIWLHTAGVEFCVSFLGTNSYWNFCQHFSGHGLQSKSGRCNIFLYEYPAALYTYFFQSSALFCFIPISQWIHLEFLNLMFGCEWNHCYYWKILELRVCCRWKLHNHST